MFSADAASIFFSGDRTSEHYLVWCGLDQSRAGFAAAVTICTRPSGAPAFAKMSPILRPTNGVSSDGLITTVFPAINAITTSPSGMLNG
jgi:hypothetical protein